MTTRWGPLVQRHSFLRPRRAPFLIANLELEIGITSAFSIASIFLIANIRCFCVRRGESRLISIARARSILSTNNLATGFRQGTAFYPEARRAAVPLHARGSGVLTPEACVRRLLGPCLRNVAVTTTHSSLVTRSSRGDRPRRTIHLSPLVVRSSRGDSPWRTTHHSRLIDNPARIVVLSDQRESKDLSSALILIAGSAIRNQNIRRDFSNFHFSNRR